MAEAVIQNLHRRWSDDLQCQPSVNYARGGNQNHRDVARTSPQKYKPQGSPRKQFHRKRGFSSQVRSQDNADVASEHVDLQNIPKNAGTDKALPFPVARRPTVVSHPSSQQPPAETGGMQEANQVDTQAIDHALVSTEKEQPQPLSERAKCDSKSTHDGNSTDTAELGLTKSHFEDCPITPSTNATAPVATQKTPTKKKGRKQSNIATKQLVNEAKQTRSDKKPRKASSPEKLEGSNQGKEPVSRLGNELGEKNLSESINRSGTLLDLNGKVLGKDSNNNPELAPSNTTQWPALIPPKSITLQPGVSGREQCGMKEQNGVREVTSSESSNLSFEQLGTTSTLLTDPSSDGQPERLLNETAKESIVAYDATAEEQKRHASLLEAPLCPAGDLAASNIANAPDTSIRHHNGKQSSIEQELVSGPRFQVEESVRIPSSGDNNIKTPVSQPVGTKLTKTKQSHIKTTRGERLIKENASETKPAKEQTPVGTGSKESAQEDNLQPTLASNVALSSSFTEGNKLTKSHAGAVNVYEPNKFVDSVTLPANTEPPIDSASISDQCVKTQILQEDTVSPQMHAIDGCIDEKTKSGQDPSDQQATKSNAAISAAQPLGVSNESKNENEGQVSNEQFNKLDSPTSLATIATPIYTHKKKQRKVTSTELKNSNQYEVLASETVQNPTEELSDSNFNVEGKEFQVVSNHLLESSSKFSTDIGVGASTVNENGVLSTADKGVLGMPISKPDTRSKSKKKAKKSKKARTSQSNSAPRSSSLLNQVETPFMTDDKKPLPRPVIRNKPSSDKAAKETPSIYQSVFRSNSVTLEDEGLNCEQGNLCVERELGGDLADYYERKEADYEPELYSLFPEHAFEQCNSARNIGNAILLLLSVPLTFAINLAYDDAEVDSQSYQSEPVVYPVQGRESETSNRVAAQHELGQSKSPSPNDQENGSIEEQIRSKQVEVDKYLKANGKASREALLRLLNSIVPENESSETYDDGVGDFLPKEADVTSQDGAASETPRVFEVIEEIPPLPPPPRSLKQRDIRLLSSRSPSPSVPVSREESEVEQPVLTPLTSTNATPKAESQPRTLVTPPPEMFRELTVLRELQHHIDDPVSLQTNEQHQLDERQVIGASEKLTNPPPPTEIGSPAANSPAHTPVVKALSYKDVASTPPAPSLQESDFSLLTGNGKGGPVGPKAKQENRERGGAGPTAEKKRRASQKADPWRVVSTSWVNGMHVQRQHPQDSVVGGRIFVDTAWKHRGASDTWIGEKGRWLDNYSGRLVQEYFWCFVFSQTGLSEAWS
ncbi:MAG: hypothetical protein Q9167_004644 [Letrouitia subvulpina]